MSSSSETGHAINVANYEKLKSFCEGFGTLYNPSRLVLKIPAINTQLTAARGSLSTEEAANNFYADVVDVREAPFKSLGTLTTRIMNAVDSCEVSDAKVIDAKSIARKIQGGRANSKKKEIAPVDPAVVPSLEEEHKQISVSQMGYDNRLENFAKLVNLLSQETGYIPNETDLKVASVSS